MASSSQHRLGLLSHSAGRRMGGGIVHNSRLGQHLEKPIWGGLASSLIASGMVRRVHPTITTRRAHPQTKGHYDLVGSDRPYAAAVAPIGRLSRPPPSDHENNTQTQPFAIGPPQRKHRNPPDDRTSVRPGKGLIRVEIIGQCRKLSVRARREEKWGISRSHPEQWMRARDHDNRRTPSVAEGGGLGVVN